MWELVARCYLIPGRTSQRGGGSDVSVSHVVRPRQRSGFEGLGMVRLGPIGSQEGTSGYRMVLYGSVYQSYTDTGQSAAAAAFRDHKSLVSGHCLDWPSSRLP